MKKKLFFNPAVYVSIIAYIIISYGVLVLGERVISLMIREDQFFEVLSVIAFLLTAGLFFYGFVLWRRRSAHSKVSLLKLLAFLGLGLLFVFGAGEEASWGQRLIGIETPEKLLEANTQDELNIHNLAIFEESDFFTADRLFDIFWFMFTVAVPGACLLWKPVNHLAHRYIPVVHWSLGALFLFNYLWAKVAKTLFKSFYSYELIAFRQAVQEIKESNYAVLFVAVALSLVLSVRRMESGHNNA